MLFSGEGVTLQREASEDAFLFVIRVTNGENRFTLEMNNELHQCLDKVEAELPRLSPAQKVALLITGTGKYFSLGLDLKSYYVSDTPQELFQATYQRLLARLLSLPLVTVAAVNGHCIAGGMVFAFCCDYIVMNEERGFMAMTEIMLPSSIPAGMLAVLQEKIKNPTLLRDILLQARKYTGKQLLEYGIVDGLAGGEEATIEAAKQLAHQKSHPMKKGPFLKLIKQVAYRESIRILTTPESIDHFKFAININKL